ncbi:MAG TPA: flagellar hook-basal body complex protein FliE [Gemmatimonadales bacterium]|nr:flagellar hook-basal body complex protein FliE [Gemmatimonadales bacterium]
MTIPIRPGIPGQVVSPLERGFGVPLGPEQSDRPFGDLLTRALGDVTRAQEYKADVIGAFLRGEQVELHQVMAAAEEASISLELLVETRNKLTEAYRTVMNIQV